MNQEQIASAVFYPRPDMGFGPDAPGSRDHLFDVEPGVRLRLRIYPGPPDAPAILFFHGNGETARDYDSMVDQFQMLPAVFLIGEYRGYGPSTGQPSLDNFLTDAHKTLDEALGQLKASGHTGPLVVMGRSLGSAPAIDLAASRSDLLSGLIIESGFARIIPLLELIGVPAKRLGLTEEMGPRNLAKMESVALPSLILHAEQDEIIPIQDAELLHAACKDPDKVFYRVPSAGHNDIQLEAGKAYFDRIGELLARLKR